MKTFKVVMVDYRVVEYYVPAESKEDAESRVLSSTAPDDDFIHTTTDGEWYIDHIEELP